ncbi:hypothetical protein Tco_0532845 [Tanacetum coccineum]
MRKKEKVKNTTLNAVPKDHHRRFHGMDDAKGDLGTIKTQLVCKFKGSKEGSRQEASRCQDFKPVRTEKEALMTIVKCSDKFVRQTDIRRTQSCLMLSLEKDAGNYHIPLYSRFKQVEYKGVPHTSMMIIPLGTGKDIDDSLFAAPYKSGGLPRFNTGKQHGNSGRMYVNSGTQNKSGGSRVNIGKQHVNSGRVHVNTARVNRPVLSNHTSQRKLTSYRINIAVKRTMVQQSSTEAYGAKSIFDSEMYWHMTVTKAHLEDYQELPKRDLLLLMEVKVVS